MLVPLNRRLSGEGLRSALTRNRERISVNDYAGETELINFKMLRLYKAIDWVKVRLRNRRACWSNARNSFPCWSHMDDSPG